MARDLVFFGVLLVLVVVSLLWRYRHPQLYGLNVVPPGRKFNRLQQLGLAYVILGVTITVGIQIIDSFHPLDSNFRAGQLGYSEGSILVGVVSFLIGWNRRRKPDSFPPE